MTNYFGTLAFPRFIVANIANEDSDADYRNDVRFDGERELIPRDLERDRSRTGNCYVGKQIKN